MAWADLNPFKRASRPSDSGAVYIGVNPSSPFAGIAVISEVKPEGASIRVEGIKIGPARLELCGKVLDWNRVPVRYIASFKTGGSVTLPIDTLKTLFK